MAIRHHYTILCEMVIHDDQDRFSYINVFQNVEVARIPVAAASLFVAVSVSGDSGDAVEVAIQDPNRKDIVTSPEQVLPAAPVGRSPHAQTSSQVVLRLQPIVFEREGVYSVLVRSRGKVVDRTRFGVFTGERTDDGSSGDTAQQPQ